MPRLSCNSKKRRHQHINQDGGNRNDQGETGLVTRCPEQNRDVKVQELVVDKADDVQVDMHPGNFTGPGPQIRNNAEAKQVPRALQIARPAKVTAWGTEPIPYIYIYMYIYVYIYICMRVYLYELYLMGLMFTNL